MKKIIIVIAGLMVCFGAVVSYGQEKAMTQDANGLIPKTEEVPSYIKEYEEGFVSQEKFFNASNNMLKIGIPAIPYLVEFAKNKEKNMWLRGRALELIGEIKDESAIKPLIDMLNDETQDAEIRAETIETLEKFANSKEIIPHFKNALKNKDSQLRTSAARALGFIKNNESLSDLIMLAEDEKQSMDTRLSAISSIGKLEDKKATEPLLNFVNSKNEDISGAAIIALGKIKDENAVGPLITIALDGNNVNSIFAIKTLGKIKDTMAIKPLLEILQGPDNYRAMEAAEALSDIGDAKVAEHIKAKIETLGVADSFSIDKMKEAYKKLTGRDFEGENKQ